MRRRLVRGRGFRCRLVGTLRLDACRSPLRLGSGGPVEIGHRDVELGLDRRLRLEYFGFPPLALPATPPAAAASPPPPAAALALGLGFGRRLRQSRIPPLPPALPPGFLRFRFFPF